MFSQSVVNNLGYMIMSRLKIWYLHQTNGGEISDSELSAGIISGDIITPDYVSISEDIDHLKIWDPDNHGSQYMGFIRIDY